VRASLEDLMAGAGFEARTFASARAFLDSSASPAPSCLVLDMHLPDLSGFEIQERIARERAELPVIIVTGHGDIPMTVRAMKAGAVEFLTKPVSAEALLSAVHGAIERSRVLLEARNSLEELRRRHAALSARECEVMALVVRGQMNKQVAGELGISEVTVKAHRGKLMRKMRARSLAELVTMASRLHLTTAKGDDSAR
jgi:FixJ family two-component response regulator